MTTCPAREGKPSPTKVMPPTVPLDGRSGDGLPKRKGLYRASFDRAEIQSPTERPQRLRGVGESLPFRGDTEHGEPARYITTLNAGS